MRAKKHILISGGESQVAKAAAQKFRQEGWAVTGIGASKQGAPDSHISCDLTDRKALVAEIDRLEKAGTHFDAVFVIIEKELDTGFEQTDIAQWEDLLKTWLGGASNLCKATTPYMIGRGGGSIVILSPDYKNSGGDNIMNAVASHTLHGLAKSFGTEVAEVGVRVNVLWPGLPFDCEAIANMAHYLAGVDAYTAASVLSIAPLDKEAARG